FAGASFDLVPGRIEFRLHGDGDISWWGIDDHFTFDVRQDFSLEVDDGGLRPVAVGDPVVDLHDVAVGGGYIEGKARTAIRDERGRTRPTEVRVDEHRFVTDVLPGRSLGGFCLTVEGTRVMAGGGTVPVSGTACYRFAPIVPPLTDWLTVEGEGEDEPPPMPL